VWPGISGPGNFLETGEGRDGKERDRKEEDFHIAAHEGQNRGRDFKRA
jgi:hypothetical protein